MADITMCRGETEKYVCPMRKSCYRYAAMANDRWQSYFYVVPFDFQTMICEEYYNKDA